MKITVKDESTYYFGPTVMVSTCSYKTLEAEVYGYRSFYSICSDGTIDEWLYDSDNIDDEFTGWFHCTACGWSGEKDQPEFERHMERRVS